jgi:hypothetical protein
MRQSLVCRLSSLPTIVEYAVFTAGGGLCGVGVLSLYSILERGFYITKIQRDLYNAKNNNMRFEYTEEVARLSRINPVTDRETICINVYKQWKKDGRWKRIMANEEERH